MILRVGFPARRSCLKTSILPNQQHNHIQTRTHQADRRPWATIRKKHARENREQARSTIPGRRSELFSGVAKLSCYTKTGSLPSQKKMYSAVAQRRIEYRRPYVCQEVEPPSHMHMQHLRRQKTSGTARKYVALRQNNEPEKQKIKLILPNKKKTAQVINHSSN